MRRGAAGDVITITDRGKPVARLVPIRKSRLGELRDAGLVSEATKNPWELAPPVAIAPAGKPSLGEVLAQLRDDERY